MSVHKHMILPFKLSLAVNLLSVLFNIINDCDETYNYLEPLHFVSTLGKGGGFQTWEYSPSFGLRSYLYLWLFGWPSFTAFLFGLPNWLSFLSVRLYLGILSSICISFLSSVVSLSLPVDKRNDRTLLAICFVCLYSFTPGSFLASTTLLPSGPAAMSCALMLAFWLNGNYKLAVGCVAFMGLVIWPFAAVLGIPLAAYMLLSGKFDILLKSALLWACFWIPPLLFVDLYYFGHIVLAPMNIIMYNIFSVSTLSKGSLSQLYGTEPVLYYLKNYLLNHNISFCAAVIVAFLSSVAFICSLLFSLNTKFLCSRSEKLSCFPQLCFLSSSTLLLWNAVFFLQPHKEERFLFPCYPLIAFASTLFLFGLVKLLRYFTKWSSFFSVFFVTVFFLIFFSLSFSRIVHLIRWYRAPIYLVKHLPTPNIGHKFHLCLGRDWHHFPSRFMLPGGAELWDVQFLQSNFSGQLPGQFKPISSSTSVADSTRLDGSHFNSLNAEEYDRYSDTGPLGCDFILDHDSPVGTREELYISDNVHWLSIFNQSILESQLCQSNLIERNDLRKLVLCYFVQSFYLPFFSELNVKYVHMHILQRQNT